jgi:ABC-2 type transport system ATP-binding protein
VEAVSGVVVEHLVVTYGDLVAVNDVSFVAPEGAVTAVIGPNGAGKTSTIEVCEGFRTATRGHVSVLGLDPSRQHGALTEVMGVMLQGGGVYPSARVADVVSLFCSLHNRGAQPDELIDLVGLSQRRRSTWRQLSGGEQQRLSLALALAAKPRVAFLDEPTSGVDIDGRDTIREVIRDLAKSGTTVVLASHELDEAERIADNVVMFRGGQVIASGSLGELRSSVDSIRFTTAASIDIASLSNEIGASVKEVTATNYVIDAVSTPEIVAQLAQWLSARNLPLTDVRTGHETLIEMYRRITGDAS